jgi:hypothetical protein
LVRTRSTGTSEVEGDACDVVDVAVGPIVDELAAGGFGRVVEVDTPPPPTPVACVVDVVEAVAVVDVGGPVVDVGSSVVEVALGAVVVVA